jgi:uncharacterized protein YggU (UPF0235/DUF167 family)
MRDPMVGAMTRHANGVRVRVRLTPKSAQDDIDGEEQLSDGSIVLSVRVRAIPANGQANAALETLLAKTVGVAKSRVSVVSGATSRIKIVDIQVAAGDIAA